MSYTVHRLHSFRMDKICEQRYNNLLETVADKGVAV